MSFLSVGAFRREIFFCAFFGTVFFAWVVCVGVVTGQVPVRKDSCDVTGSFNASFGSGADSGTFVLGISNDVCCPILRRIGPRGVGDVGVGAAWNDGRLSGVDEEADGIAISPDSFGEGVS